MHVEPGADARDQRNRHDTLQPDEVFRIGQLDVVVRSRHHFHGFSGRFQQRGIVGRAGQACPVGGEKRVEPEGLWGLGTEQSGPRHGLGDHAAHDALQRVGDRSRRNRAWRFRNAASRAGIVPSGMTGRAAS